MDQEDRVYTSKVICIQHYYGNIMDGNHGSGSHPNEDIKVLNEHQVSYHLYTLSLVYEEAKPAHPPQHILYLDIVIYSVDLQRHRIAEQQNLYTKNSSYIIRKNEH